MKKKTAMTEGESPSRLIDARIKELDDWRGKTLSHVRALIKHADPEELIALSQADPNVVSSLIKPPQAGDDRAADGKGALADRISEGVP